MDRIVVVGSGASGVHFALTVLKKGYDVLMLDVGRQGSEVVADGSFAQMKNTLPDPVKYFLGADFEGVLFPDDETEYYGIPPSKTYVFSRADVLPLASRGFSPLLSFAQGGLAQSWTGGAYPFNDDDLAEFPFGYAELEPFYGEVARRIGIAGVCDDLSRFIPLHKHLLQPLRLDRHSAQLLADYEKQKRFLNVELGCYLGRARVATLTQPLEGRPACSSLGRCLWGCPTGAFYTPSLTLRECATFSNFHYVAGVHVSHFTVNSQRTVQSVVVRAVASNTWREFPVDKLVLAGGTLSSSAIVLTSIFKHTGETVRLDGLMDNRQVLMPFVNLKLIGRQYDPDSYQYHQIAMGIVGEHPHQYVHGLITTLKAALIHPIAQAIPFDLRTSTTFVRNLHAALGLLNVNFHDWRRSANYLTLERTRDSQPPMLAINYSAPESEQVSIATAVRRFRRALRKLACVAPARMLRVRPMGAGVHYAGTIPMSTKPGSLTTSEVGESRDFKNLYLVDGTTFPSLPAKNITFTLMANAIRIAERAF